MQKFGDIIELAIEHDLIIKVDLNLKYKLKPRLYCRYTVVAL
jgi:hypothetical protein